MVSEFQDAIVDNVLSLLTPCEHSVAEHSDRFKTTQNAWFEGGVLRFTLSGLYDLSDLGHLCSYLEFRTAIYQSNINQRLSLAGYKIDIFESTGKVDTTIYQLTEI